MVLNDGGRERGCEKGRSRVSGVQLINDREGRVCTPPGQDAEFTGGASNLPAIVTADEGRPEPDSVLTHEPPEEQFELTPSLSQVPFLGRGKLRTVMRQGFSLITNDTIRFLSFSTPSLR